MVKVTVKTKDGQVTEYTEATMREAVGRFVNYFFNDYAEVHFTNVYEVDQR